jgi:hypothetical protein
LDRPGSERRISAKKGKKKLAMPKINRSTRHQKIVGEFGEHLVCNWLSRSGFEVSRVDHTGIDVVAYNPKLKKRYGITVKARTRMLKRESSAVYIFRRGDRKKMLAACKYFGCRPWIAIYVESEKTADLYMTSLKNYDAKYRVGRRKIDAWKMTKSHMTQFFKDSQVRHIHVDFKEQHWWSDKEA